MVEIILPDKTIFFTCKLFDEAKIELNYSAQNKAKCMLELNIYFGWNTRYFELYRKNAVHHITIKINIL